MVKDGRCGFLVHQKTSTDGLSASWYGSNLLRFGTFDRLPKSHQGAPPGSASSAIFSSFLEATRWASPEAVLNLTGCTFRVAIASYGI